MRYATVLKFIAVILCAAALLGMVGSAAGILAVTELGNRSVQEQYTRQLQSRATAYGNQAAEIWASEDLGNMPRNLMNQFYGGDWEGRYFDWSRVGYTLCDSEGRILAEKEIPDSSLPVWQSYDLAVGGRYHKFLSAVPVEASASQHPADPAGEGTRVTVMPSQDSTAVFAVIVDYTDGSRKEWQYDGTQKGALYHENGGITFRSNIGELPMGDRWYPSHILFADQGGNIVYEAYSDDIVILGSSLDGSSGMIEWYLPAGTVTTAAPVGVTYSSGDYTSYDAIPDQGITVSSMSVTYARPGEGDIGSEGITSPELIGTVFHVSDGNVRFLSTEPMTMDIPENCILTHISFADSRQNRIFEARCPSGVGTLEYDQEGCLVFAGAMPGTQGAAPAQDAEAPGYSADTAVKPVPEEAGEVTAAANATVNLYALPGEKKVSGACEQGQLLVIRKQRTLEDGVWGMTEKGWLPMDQVTVLTEEALEAGVPVSSREEIPVYSTPAPSDPVDTLQAGQTGNLLLAGRIGGQDWALLEEGWVLMDTLILAQLPEPASLTRGAVPEESVPQPLPAEAETLPAARPEETVPQESQPETVPDHTEPELPAEYLTADYYDGETGQTMEARYVMEAIPDGYVMTVHLAEGAMGSGLSWTLLRLAEALEHLLLEILGICIAVFALCVVHLSCSAGRTRRTNEVRAGGLNRIPLDLYLVGGGFAEVGLVAAAICGSEYLARNDEQLAIVFCGGCAYLASLLLVAFFFACVAQAKTPGGFWWRNSLCGRCLRFVARCGRGLVQAGKKNLKPLAGRGCRWLTRACRWLWGLLCRSAAWLWDTVKSLYAWVVFSLGRCLGWTAGRLARFFGMLPITWQFLGVGFLLVFLLYIMIRTYKVGYILLGFGIFFAVILYAASAFAILLESAKKMSQGDLDTKVNDKMLIGGFRDFARELNALADVAVIAAQKQLKSERMKTELITNVSHDIKTPLTSIINYVDLLRKPHTQDQQEQYLEVLDRQSLRLKKMVDDLMEMSKASTGNLAVEIETINAAEAVNQSLGEFADKLEKARLIPVFRQPEDPVYMMADGRLVWRVMSNLLSNAVKYALPGTRVYLDLLEMEGKVIISMKNISREELNVNADELMERFVRGDASRNTEGSGLGLNIARSLMELQRGQLQILVDGDLFKVTLIFPKA